MMRAARVRPLRGILRKATKNLLYTTILLIITCGHSQAANPKPLLPIWPITNIGSAIDDDTLTMWRNKGDRCAGARNAYTPFPSKGTRKDMLPEAFPGASCDDGDQTLFNGLLCASGIEDGCVAVAQAQAESGRWYRSPHRKWLWSNFCFKAGTDEKSKDFRDLCANGFSPDMSLGVMLYAVKKKDANAYRRWLHWLDAEAANTKICSVQPDGTIGSDCQTIEWPRVCTHDLGYSEEPAPFKIFGKEGGRCALRPPDALDFAAVNDATHTAPPKRMAAWETESRVTLKAILSLSGVSEIPPLLLVSATDPVHFPLHLDATRVLLRMLINNPSLRTSNLPKLPKDTDLLSFFDPLAATGSDPISISAAAKVISARASWNPFYRLLAEGPTPTVRSMILESCPTAQDRDQDINKRSWLWEKEKTQLTKANSMYWDCLFLGTLYNRMRVKQSVVSELLDTFLQYADRTDTILQLANRNLQNAEAALGLAQKTLDEANRAQKDALEYAGNAYAQQNQRITSELQSLQRQGANAAASITGVQNRIAQQEADIVSMLETIQQPITKRVCDVRPPFDPVGDELCRNVTTITSIANPAKTAARSALEGLRSQHTLLTRTLVDIDKGITQAQSELAELDARHVKALADVSSKVFDLAIKQATADLVLQTRVTQGLRQAVATARESHARFLDYVSVWRPKNEGSDTH